jgi:hypothetical protein
VDLFFLTSGCGTSNAKLKPVRLSHPKLLETPATDDRPFQLPLLLLAPPPQALHFLLKNHLWIIWHCPEAHFEQWIHHTQRSHSDCHFDRYSTMPTMFHLHNS